MLTPRKITNGFKENEMEINRIKFEIEDAISARNYSLAEQLHRSLKLRVERRKQILASQQHDSRVSDIINIRNQQNEEEKQLRLEMRDKAYQAISAAKERLAAINEKHRNQLAALDERFSQQSFAQLRLNHDFYIDRRAEDYYSHNNDFQVAAFIKRDISEKTMQKIENTEIDANKAVNSHIEYTVAKQEKEKAGFKIHLENEKNRLIKETMVEMNRISNKYSKMRQKIVGSAKCDKEGDIQRKLRQENHGISQMINSIFEEFENSITIIGMEPKEPVSARAPQSARYSFRPSTPRMDSQELSGIRNPRVIKALEKSILKRELAVINSSEPLYNIV